MKKNFFEKLKNMFKKIKFNPFGGGVLFLISLSLISGGLASFLITDKNIQAELNGVVNVASVEEFISLDKTNDHPNGYDSFNICKDGFYDENGLISNTGIISYYVNIDVIKAQEFISNNSLSLRFSLTENYSNFFINSSKNYFSISCQINDENNVNTQINDTTATSDIVDINTTSQQLKLKVSFVFNINEITDSFKSDLNLINTINFSLLVEGVRND